MNNNQEYNSDLPQFDAKQGYLQSVFQKRQNVMQTLSLPELPKSSMNLYYQVLFIINDEVRDYELAKTISEQLDSNINNKLSEYKEKYKLEPDREKYIEIVLSESVKIMREVTKYNDKFLNIATENKVKISKFECVNCPDRLKALKENTKLQEIYEDENENTIIQEEL